MPRLTLLTLLLTTGPAFAQSPSPADGGRQPITSSGGGSSFDQNRIPVTSGAGTGINIESFPMNPMPVAPIAGPSQAPRPQLSPYLNLVRGFGNGGGLTAIDYYNFVRPAEQATGSYTGRAVGLPLGVAGRSLPSAVDPETGLQSATRAAGTPSAFMNYGSYFNRLGSIGTGGRAAAQPPRR